MTAPAKAYIQNQVLAATPEQLRLMLYDGTLRFLHNGRAGVEEKDYEKAYLNLSKAQKIVLELSSSLKREAMPEVCDNLSALYTYIYGLLVDANMNRVTEPIDEAMKLIQYERETWIMMMEKNAADAA